MCSHGTERLLCVAAALEAGGQHHMTLHLLDAMQNAGIVVDLETYKAALRSLAQAGRHQESLMVLAEIKKAQMQPDLATAEAVIHSHVAGGKLVDAVRLASEFHRQGLDVKEKHLAAMISV